MTADLSPEAIITEGIRVYVEGYLDGYGAVEDSPRERAHFATDIAENMAEVLMERLRDAGRIIVPSEGVAVVELPADPGDEDYLRWSNWHAATEKAFYDALLVETRRIIAIGTAAAASPSAEEPKPAPVLCDKGFRCDHKLGAPCRPYWDGTTDADRAAQDGE